MGTSPKGTGDKHELTPERKIKASKDSRQKPHPEGPQTDPGQDIPSEHVPGSPTKGRTRDLGRVETEEPDITRCLTTRESRVEGKQRMVTSRIASESPARPGKKQRRPRGNDRGRDRSVLEMWGMGDRMKITCGRRDLESRSQGDPRLREESRKEREWPEPTDYQTTGQRDSHSRSPKGGPKRR